MAKTTREIQSITAKALNEFYQDYRLWLLKGAPNEQPFQRDVGLCGSLDLWVDGKYDKYEFQIRMRMEMQFVENKLLIRYPFNDGHAGYAKEANRKRLHLNQERRSWVFAHSLPIKDEQKIRGNGLVHWYRNHKWW